MTTRISTLVAIVVSGGILFSVGSPAVAKGAGFNNGSISIKREAKLIRVIRFKLAKLKVKRVEKLEAIVVTGRGNGNATRAQSVADPIVAKTKRVADPVEATTGQPLRRSAQ